MKRFSQTLKVMLALFVAIFSNGLLPTTAAYAAQGQNPPGNNGTLKVHEIGTPSGTESNDPKVCSFNFEGFGFDNGQTGFIIIDKQQSSSTYGPYNVGPASSNGYFISQDFNTQSGVTIPNGSYKATMYGKDTPYGQPTEKAKSKVFKVECVPQEVIVPSVVVNDLCGKKDDSFTVPVTEHVTYKYKIGNGSWHSVTEGVAIPAVEWGWTYTVVASAENGYVLTGDTTQTFKFTNEPCVTVIPIPETPKVEDPCGAHNARWIVPEDTDMIDWSLVNGHLIATAKKGYIFEGQKTFIDFGEAKDSNVPCIIEIPKPETPKVYDPCGLHNARWIIPKDTMQIDWSLSYDGNLIATAKKGYIFEGQQQSINFGKAEDSGELCPVTPKAPKFIDYCGEQTDYVYIPYVKGVFYKIDGKVVYSGYHKASGTVTVKAYAEHDYELVGEEVGPWTYTYVNTECISITKKSQPVTDTNKDGYIGIGDVVTWEITVTNNSSNKLDDFKVQIEDSTATLANDGLIEHLEPGESITITATSTLTATDMQACKATNTVTFMAWFNRHGDERDRHDDKFEKNMLSLNVEHEDEYDLSGLTTAEATFTCPTPGSGNGGTTTTTSTTSELPAELPATGPADNSNPLLVLAAAAVAYGATYFIQRRRELASN